MVCAHMRTVLMPRAAACLSVSSTICAPERSPAHTHAQTDRQTRVQQQGGRQRVSAGAGVVSRPNRMLAKGPHSCAPTCLAALQCSMLLLLYGCQQSPAVRLCRRTVCWFVLTHCLGTPGHHCCLNQLIGVESSSIVGPAETLELQQHGHKQQQTRSAPATAAAPARIAGRAGL